MSAPRTARAIGHEHRRVPVKDQVVIPADLIHKQKRFCEAAHMPSHDPMSPRNLVDLKRTRRQINEQVHALLT